MRRSHRRGRAAVILPTAVAAVLLLAGCAPEPGEPTPEPSEPVVTSTPTSEPVAEPGPRTPLDCAGIIDGGGLDGLFRGTPELSPEGQPSTFSAAMDQAGAIRCSWRLGNDASFSLALEPLDILESGDDWTPDCSVQPDFHQCGVSISLADFRLETMLVDFRGGIAADALATQVQALWQRIGENVDGAGILPRWQSPEHSTVAYGDCTPLASPEITATLHPLAAASNGDSGDGFSGVYRAMEVAGYGSCTFAIPDPDHPAPVQGSYNVEWVPGGGWAWPISGDPIDVSGADEAVSRCLPEGYCMVDARVGDTWVSGGFGNSEYDIATAARYLAAIIPSLPVE